MYAAKYIFSAKFFVAWVVVSIIWVWGTMLVAGFYPIVDGWDQIALVLRGVTGRLLGKKGKPASAQVLGAETLTPKGESSDKDQASG